MGELTSSLGRLVYLDTNIIVYAVEGFKQYEESIKSILAAMDEGNISVVTSELTLAEVLVKPKYDKNEHLQDAYREFLKPSAVFHLAPITQEILIEAAEIRAASNLKLPDAIHVTTALNLRCDTFLTNDRTFLTITSIPIKLISEMSG